MAAVRELGTAIRWHQGKREEVEYKATDLQWLAGGDNVRRCQYGSVVFTKDQVLDILMWHRVLDEGLSPGTDLEGGYAFGWDDVGECWVVFDREGRRRVCPWARTWEAQYDLQRDIKAGWRPCTGRLALLMGEL